MTNAASELGPRTFDWWPDWRGQRVAIIASGPSVRKTDIALLRGRLPVLAIKENVDLAPWADVVYGCDGPWWKNCQGLPKFRGLKLSNAVELRPRYKDIRIVCVDTERDEILTSVPTSIGSGGNSGFQALNLAVQFGAIGVLLIGFDMTDRSGVHWFGRANGPGRNNPCEQNFRRWRAAFAANTDTLAELGVEVVNASPTGTLKCFPKRGVADQLQAWRL